MKPFCLDIEAKKVSQITIVSRPIISEIFDKIREFVAKDCEQVSPFKTDEIEIYENCFGTIGFAEYVGV